MMLRKNGTGRRQFLTASGVAVGSLAAWPRDAFNCASDAIDPPQVTLVKEFLLSWSKDMRSVLSYLTDDCECRLTQWGPDRKGHDQIADALATYVGRPRSVITRIFECSCAESLVLAHFENRYVYEHGDLVWEGVGTFFVKGDKIKEWRGYTVQVGH
jgi:hypothetical protein